MTLLAPWALWFLAAAGVVVALYLLKIKRRRQSVPALDFWLQLAGRTRVHSLFDRLKRLLSMLLWLAIVACLVLALGNPVLSLGRIKPRAIAIVIDNSASMQAVEPGDAGADGATRLDLARRAIADLTTRRPVSDQYLLIEAAREPRVLQPWTHDTKSVRSAGDDLEPFGGSGDLAAAVELAAQLLAGKEEPTIVVISDGAAGKVESLAEADARIVPWPIGESRDNLGIARLSVRPHRQNSNHHALISIVNASDEAIETQLTLEIDGSATGVELVNIEPGAVWEKSIVIEAPAGGILRASLDRTDTLALDNEAYAILQPIRPAVVWLVTPPEEAFFFEQALASMEPLIWPEQSLTLPPEQFEAALAAANPTDHSAPPFRKPDLVIFNNAAPEKLPAAGRYILINAWPAELPLAISGAIDAPQLFLAPRPHQLTQHLTLQGVRLAQARKVSLTEPARVLAHTPAGDPLIVLLEQRDRQSLCLAFDVLDSDLPFRNAFPLLLRNAVAYLHEDAPAWIAPEHRIGELVQPVRPLPAGTGEVTLERFHAGERTEQPMPIADPRFVFSDTARPGAVRFTFGEESFATAINIADADESRIATMTAADPSEALALSGRFLGAVPWVALAAIAAMLIGLEWLTYNLRWTE